MEDMIHKYVKKPENIRQIGESPYSGPIYIEDYVMTYIRQIFKEQSEEKIILMLGKEGEELAKGSTFIYGAIGVDFNVTDAVTDISEKDWSEAYEKIYKYFPGVTVMGWVCGVYMWNSKVDATINIIQRKYFSKESNILFLFDLSECEEKIFKWYDGNLKEQSGYYVFYEKNPQMQDFVLGENQNESVDREYDDVVTEVIRDRVNKNEKKDSVSKTAIAALTMAIAFMFVIGGNYMIESVSKINSLEDSVDVLQGYVKTTYGDDDNSKNVSGAGIGAEWDKEENADKVENAKKISMTKEKTGNSVQSSDTEKKRKSNDKNTGTGKNNSLSTARRDRLKRKKTAGKVNKIKRTGKMSKAARQTINNRKNIKRITGSHRNYAEYKVKEGDTLSTIVWRQYHTLKKMNMVKRVNRIQDSDNIREGQVIKLPAR